MNKKITIECSTCHNLFERTKYSIQINTQINGQYICLRCKMNTKEYINKQKLANPKTGSKWDQKVEVTCAICKKLSMINYRSLMHKQNHKISIRCKSCALKQSHHEGKFQQIYTEEHLNKLKQHGIIGRKKSAQWWTDEHRFKAHKSFIDKVTQIHNGKYNYSKVEYIDYYHPITILCPIHGEFQQTPDIHLRGCGCQKCAYTLSKPQLEIYNWTKDNLGFENIILNDRNAVNPLELDIYIPNKNIAIEFHGLYWHSFNNVETIEEKHKHYNKCNICIDNNIQLIQVFENEWRDKQEIIKSIIANKLGKSQSIYARKCEIKLLLRHEHKQFMDANHLQGGKGCTVAYGLFYNDELVSCMSFNKHKKYGWEITRFANKLDISVVGGASRLFKYFIKCCGPEQILTYADRRFSDGGLYRKLGFKLDGVTKSNYFYTDNMFVFSRQQFMKHKLKKRLRVFDEGLTEVENMFNNGYRRLWDAGHWRFIWEKTI